MPKIVPIASGKGGVGKTFLTANLAIALAEAGHRTIAVDMDLGGSNLYSFLGIPNRFPGIGDFLKARSAELEDLQVKTGYRRKAGQFLICLNLDFLDCSDFLIFHSRCRASSRRSRTSLFKTILHGYRGIG